MKKIFLFLMALAVATTIGARTLRVNNVESEGAQYLTPADAMADAADGDVIILEASPKSYGDIVVNKAITLQGAGYFLNVNNKGSEGAANTEVGTITINAEGAKVSSVYAYKINMNGDKTIVTRCNTQNITLGLEFSYKERGVKDCIIHQNFIQNGLRGDNYSGTPSGIQITNNIFLISDNSSPNLYHLSNSTIAYNTFRRKTYYSYIENCSFDHNIGLNIEDAGKSNSYTDNYIFTDSKTYSSAGSKSDVEYKDIDKSLTSEAGAFAGSDPYRLSGRPSVPVIELLETPTSVVQGNDLKVSIKIGIPE